MQGIKNRENGVCVLGGYRKLSVLSAQFLCQPKTVLNIRVLILKNGTVAKTTLCVFPERPHLSAFLELFGPKSLSSEFWNVRRHNIGHC